MKVAHPTGEGFALGRVTLAALVGMHMQMLSGQCVECLLLWVIVRQGDCDPLVGTQTETHTHRWMESSAII